MKYRVLPLSAGLSPRVGHDRRRRPCAVVGADGQPFEPASTYAGWVARDGPRTELLTAEAP
jgi:hypothetical protein